MGAKFNHVVWSSASIFYTQISASIFPYPSFGPDKENLFYSHSLLG